LIRLDTLHELLCLNSPTVFLRVLDGIELCLDVFYTLLQSFDLVDGQSQLSEEQIAHSDV
jgi:hypothetical protein